MHKLLLVDDEYESRNTLGNCFPWSQAGFEVFGQVDNGRAALEVILNNHIDVVLCDIKMPVMSGIELAQELYARKINVILVFLSAYRDFEYAQKALEFGVRYYIIKPAKYEELMDIFGKIKSEIDSINKVLKEEREEFNFQDKIIDRVKSYINENYSTATLEEIARSIHLNPSYLSQFFKNNTGQNFSEYLIEVKMKKAAELLKDINLKTYDISEIVGYTNPKNFSRTFKCYFGISPREYRNSKMSIEISVEDCK